MYQFCDFLDNRTIWIYTVGREKYLPKPCVMLYAFSSRLPCLYTSMSVLPWCWGTNCSAELSVVNRQAKYTEPYVLTRCNSVFDVLQTVIFLSFWAPSVAVSRFTIKFTYNFTAVHRPAAVRPSSGVLAQLFRTKTSLHWKSKNLGKPRFFDEEIQEIPRFGCFLTRKSRKFLDFIFFLKKPRFS